MCSTPATSAKKAEKNTTESTKIDWDDFDKKYETTSVYENIKRGTLEGYLDAFELLGSGIARSAPVSIGMMYGGAEAGIAKTMAGSTLAMTGAKRIELEGENPELPELDKTLKSLGLAGAETVFGAISEGTMGKVYKDILLKEGEKQAAGVVFKQGLMKMYETALKKYGGLTGALGEGIEEVATTITQNMIEGKPAYQGIEESFIQGVGGGAVYGAPINIANVSANIKNSYNNRQIDKILESDTNSYTTIKDAFSTPEISKDKLDIVQKAGAYKKLEKELSKGIKEGEYTELEAEDYKKEFLETNKALVKTQGVKLSEENKVEAIKLIREKEVLKDEIKNMDDALATGRKARLEEINTELTNLSSSPSNKEVKTNEEISQPTEPTTNVTEDKESGFIEEGQTPTETKTDSTEVTPESDYSIVDQTFEKSGEKVQEPSGVTIGESLGNKVEINAMDGDKLVNPVVGDLSVENQKVLLTTEDNKVFDLGDVDKVSNLDLSQIPKQDLSYVQTEQQNVNEQNQTTAETPVETGGATNIQEGADTSLSGNVETEQKTIKERADYSKKAKEVAGNIRKLKVNSDIKSAMSKLNNRPTAIFEAAWDSSIEATAQAVELTGNVAQAIVEGLDQLKRSDWYQGLSDKGKQKAERMFKETLDRQYEGNIEPKSTLAESYKTSKEEVKEFVTQKFVDKFYTLRKTIRESFNIKNDKMDFSQAEILMHGKTANSLENFDKDLDLIKKKMFSKGFNTKQVSDYLYAKHAQERNEHIKNNIDPENEFGSGMTLQEATDILEKTYTKSQIESLEDIARDFYKIIEGTRLLMREKGLITEEQYLALKDYYKNYVPLTGFENENIDSSSNIQGSKLDIQGTVVDRASGRSTKADEVIANIISQRVSMSIKAHKNEVLQTLYNLAKSEPDNGVMKLYKKGSVPKTVKVTQDGKIVERIDDTRIREDYVGVKVDGEQYFLKFANKDLGKILNASNVERADVVTKTLRGLNRYLSTTMTTLNPEFVVSNFLRDIETGIYNSLSESDINPNLREGITKNMVRDTPKAIKAIYGNERGGKTDTEFQKYYEEFKANGAKTGWANQVNLSDIKRNLENSFKEYSSTGLTYTNAKVGVKKMFEFVEDVNTSVENGVRLSAYINARRAGMTEQQAAAMAKELTVNFNKSGEYGTVANSLFLFFNAGVQGTTRFLKSMTTLKKTINSEGKVSKSLNKSQKLALGMTAFASLLTLLNQSLSDDDEDGKSFYSKIPDSEKERNMILMNPINGKDYYKIPLPYGYNLFHNFGMLASEVASGDREVGDGIGFLTSSLIGALSPVSFGQNKGFLGSIGNAVTPTALKPIYELNSNEDYFGSKIYNENLPFGTPKPDSSMGRRNTPEVFKAVASFLNEVSGGNEFESGSVDVAPESMYYMYKFAVGGTGRFLTNVAETSSSVAKGEKLEVNKIPFVRTVYGEPNKYVDQAQFFDRLSSLKQKREAVANGVASEEDLNNKSKIIHTANDFEEISRKMKKVRDVERKAQMIEDPVERKSKMEELDSLYFGLVKKANKLYNENLK